MTDPAPRPVRPVDPSAPGVVAVAQLSFIGDMVFTTPLLDALREHWPAARVVVVGRPETLAVLEDHPSFDVAVEYDKLGRHRGLRGLLSVSRRLRGLAPDWFLGVSRSTRTSLLGRLSGAAVRVGFAEAGFRQGYQRRVRRRDPETPFTARPLRLLSAVDASGEPRPMRLRVRDSRRERASARLRSAGWGGGPLLAVAPGAHFGTKRWPEEHWLDLLHRLLESRAVQPALLGGPEENELIGRLVRRCPGVLDRRGLGVGEMVAEIALASGFLGGDSGPSHVARALGIPTLVLHGPTPVAPLLDGSGYRHVSRGLDCQPCSTSGDRFCPLGHHRCMRELTPETVLAGLKPLLGRGITGEPTVSAQAR